MNAKTQYLMTLGALTELGKDIAQLQSRHEMLSRDAEQLRAMLPMDEVYDCNRLLHEFQTGDYQKDTGVTKPLCIVLAGTILEADRYAHDHNADPHAILEFRPVSMHNVFHNRYLTNFNRGTHIVITSSFFDKATATEASQLADECLARQFVVTRVP